ncbi:hypothetical protein [Bradyrhizobium neotropicale]|uniref:hypothetical protein n=1 Tax=Bradyrhizobium neotropicale TaxID=1497615 RepID=UPI001AD689D3|nr:hypothetical protein [Bradyrhizobium neotropicale]MBO4221995.1 hypothetical protein [Bradyrhizobium neotropicale]
MRQLSLFKGQRQRGEEPPPLEFAVHVVLADLIRATIAPGWRATHLPLGEVRDHAINKYGRRYSPSGTRLKRMGVTPGWPDWMFVGLNRRVCFIELKRARKGRLSVAQSDIAQHLKACDIPYLCTNSINEAVAFLKAHGIVRATIQV